MSSTYGDNSKPQANSDKYRNSEYWDNLEKEKKKKRKKSKDK